MNAQLTHNRRLDGSDRFWTKVDRSNGPESCWTWLGATDGRHGYGHIFVDGRTLPAHRVAWFLSGGQIPDGWQLDHLCRNPSCVNPLHLDPVTPRENTLRSPLARARRTNCPQGHEYTPENTWVSPRNQRHCRRCGLERMRRYRAEARR